MKFCFKFSRVRKIVIRIEFRFIKIIWFRSFEIWKNEQTTTRIFDENNIEHKNDKTIHYDFATIFNVFWMI